ncbi:hypothetical protein ECG_08090 [Echinococcus granulosus]|nr:hypothetical protein ECG_08090 [Echinococcus granulosus]
MKEARTLCNRGKAIHDSGHAVESNHILTPHIPAGKQAFNICLITTPGMPLPRAVALAFASCLTDTVTWHIPLPLPFALNSFVTRSLHSTTLHSNTLPFTSGDSGPQCSHDIPSSLAFALRLHHHLH